MLIKTSHDQHRVRQSAGLSTAQWPKVYRYAGVGLAADWVSRMQGGEHNRGSAATPGPGAEQTCCGAVPFVLTHATVSSGDYTHSGFYLLSALCLRT